MAWKRKFICELDGFSVYYFPEHWAHNLDFLFFKDNLCFFFHQNEVENIISFKNKIDVNFLEKFNIREFIPLPHPSPNGDNERYRFSYKDSKHFVIWDTHNDFFIIKEVEKIPHQLSKEQIEKAKTHEIFNVIYTYERW